MKTIRLKVRKESYPWLDLAAIEVNQVWNWANETSYLAATRTDTKKAWLSGYDLNNLSAGASKYFDKIGSDTIQRIGSEYAAKRKTAKQVKLKWRVSGGSRRSLGWVPFKSASLKRSGNLLRFCGKSFRVFEADKIIDVIWRQGCFAQDACGDWWLCLSVEVADEPKPAPLQAVGIDLGLKAIATTSDGDTLEAGRWYRGIESK